MQISRSPRQRVLKAGKIILNHGTSVLDCTVRNLSEGGASVELPSTHGVPAEFELAVAGQPGRQCRVVWKRTGRIGVRFT